MSVLIGETWPHAWASDGDGRPGQVIAALLGCFAISILGAGLCAFGRGKVASGKPPRYVTRVFALYPHPNRQTRFKIEPRPWWFHVAAAMFAYGSVATVVLFVIYVSARA